MGFMLPVTNIRMIYKMAAHGVNDVQIDRYKHVNVHITNLHFSLISTSLAMAMKNTACFPNTFACALTTSGERR